MDNEALSNEVVEMQEEGIEEQDRERVPSKQGFRRYLRLGKYVVIALIWVAFCFWVTYYTNYIWDSSNFDTQGAYEVANVNFLYCVLPIAFLFGLATIAIIGIDVLLFMRDKGQLTKRPHK